MASAREIKNWEVKPSAGNHFDALDGMRGIAILMVVSFHTFFTNPESGGASRILGLLFNTGGMGVPIFFVLSGFLISYPFFRQREGDKQSWYVKGYVRRRAGKIIPPFYLSILIFVIYYLIRFSNPAYLLAGLQWGLGLANFIRPAASIPAPYWSLLIEVHFYVLLPFFFFLTKGRSSRQASLLIFTILMAVPLVVRQLTWPGNGLWKDDINFSMNRFPCSLDFFSWGVLFAGFFVSCAGPRDKNRAFRYFGYAGMIVLLAAIGLHMFWAGRFDITFHPLRWSVEAFHFLPSIATFLLLFFLFDPDCAGSRFFALPPLRFIGIVSYEWFLFHQPVVLLFREMLISTHGNLFLYVLRTICPLALTFAFSVAVYRYFSFPMMQWFRGSQFREQNLKTGLAPETTYKG